MVHEEGNNNSEKHTENKEKPVVTENQSPEPQHEQRSSWQYFLGLGIGLVPLILALIGIGGLSTAGKAAVNILSGVVVYACPLYAGLFVVSVVCLAIKRIRFVGYGILTMVIAIPVISFIGCLVLTSVPHG